MIDLREEKDKSNKNEKKNESVLRDGNKAGFFEVLDSSLMGQSSILINGFGMGLEIFF